MFGDVGSQKPREKTSDNDSLVQWRTGYRLVELHALKRASLRLVVASRLVVLWVAVIHDKSRTDR